MRNIDHSVTTNPASGEQRACHDDVSTSNSKNVLFIILPNQEVATVKHFDDVITAHVVKAQLELVCGVPAQLFTLYMPSGRDIVDDRKLTFGKDIQAGTVLRMRVFTSWSALYTAVCRNDIDELVHNGGVRMADHATFCMKDAGDLHATITERAFVALFLASHKGFQHMCSALIALGASPGGRTPFGRTPLHAAAAQDNLSICQDLIQHGADHTARDCQEHSPLEVAMDFGAFTCETWLRLNSMSLCGGARCRPKSHKERCGRPVSGMRLSDRKSPRSKSASALRQSAPGQVYFATEAGDVHMIARNSTVTNKSAYNYPCNDLMSTHENLATNGISQNEMSHNLNYNADQCAGGSTEGSYSDERAISVDKTTDHSCQRGESKVVTIQVPLHETNSISNHDGLTVPTTTPRSSTITMATADYKVAKNEDHITDQECSVKLDEKDQQEMIKDTNKNYGSTAMVSRPRMRASSARAPAVRYTSSARMRIQNSRRPHTALPHTKTVSTWMAGRKTSDESDKQKQERFQRNKIAFDRWLARKRREANRQSDEVSETPTSTKNMERRSENQVAYNKWLDKKEDHFEHLRELKIKEMKGEKSPVDDSKRMTIFQLENTDPEPIDLQPPDEYAYAFQNWLRVKKSKERSNKERHRVSSAPLEVAQRRYEQKRRRLLTEALTYEEWLDLKSEEESLHSKESEGTQSNQKREKQSIVLNPGLPLSELKNGTNRNDQENVNPGCVNHTPRIYSYKNWTYNKKPGMSSLPAKGRGNIKKPPSQCPLIISQYVYPQSYGQRVLTPRKNDLTRSGCLRNT